MARDLMQGWGSLGDRRSEGDPGRCIVVLESIPRKGVVAFDFPRCYVEGEEGLSNKFELLIREIPASSECGPLVNGVFLGSQAIGG